MCSRHLVRDHQRDDTRSIVKGDRDDVLSRGPNGLQSALRTCLIAAPALLLIGGLLHPTETTDPIASTRSSRAARTDGSCPLDHHCVDAADGRCRARAGPATCTSSVGRGHPRRSVPGRRPGAVRVAAARQWSFPSWALERDRRRSAVRAHLRIRLDRWTCCWLRCYCYQDSARLSYGRTVRTRSDVGGRRVARCAVVRVPCRPARRRVRDRLAAIVVGMAPIGWKVAR